MSETVLLHDGADFRRQSELTPSRELIADVDEALIAAYAEVMLHIEKIGLQIEYDPETYATDDIENAVIWGDVFEALRVVRDIPLEAKLDHHLTVFRSERNKLSEEDAAELTRLDEEALKEAMRNSATEDDPSIKLLWYFSGSLTKEGRCMSFCLWTTKDEARKATDHGDAHKAARRIARKAYKGAKIESYRFERSENAKAAKFTPSADVWDLFDRTQSRPE